MFPGDILEFFFDQSSAHGAFAKDALNAKDMNVKPGGKQRRMRDTHIPQDNPNATLRGRCQSMVFPLDLPSEHPDYNYRGQPKGMLRVREERDLVASLKAVNGGKLVGECSVCKLSREAQERLLREAQAAMVSGEEEPSELRTDITAASSSRTCCMRKALSMQQDFRDEKPLLQVVIEDAGHICHFLPKFHCELNPIEMYWGWTKARESSLRCGTRAYLLCLMMETCRIPHGSRWHFSHSKTPCTADS